MIHQNYMYLLIFLCVHKQFGYAAQDDRDARQRA